jgi:acetolactate synthase-1/2/3 large subunit
MQETIAVNNVAEGYLRLLGVRGIEFIFGNGGTDFAPLIEAYSRAQGTGARLPQPIAVPHENAAVAMAHGYTAMTGKPQVVMAHVNVGTANMIGGVINAARARVPMLVTAGRTPLTEDGELHGARAHIIHWAQEMYDQAGMLREVVKWDYELRNGVQLESVVDRMLEVATTEPAGPVYLTLPREVLAAPLKDITVESTPRRGAVVPPAPEPQALEQLADWLAGARLPLIITTDAGRDPATFDQLSELTDRFGIGVIEFFPSRVALSADHPMHLGYQHDANLNEADVVVVLESDVPWIPAYQGPNPHAKVAHVGVDPVFDRYPMRSYPSDLSLTADAATTLAALRAALTERAPRYRGTIDQRRARIKQQHDAQRAAWAAELADTAGAAPIDARWASHCLAQVTGPEAILVNEYPLVREQVQPTQPGTFLNHSPAGGLGWGFGAALGAKLARPDQLVVAALGDGAYMFGNPTPCHLVAAAEELPVLVVVFNNASWHAVRRATTAMYPEGAASHGAAPFISLAPAPAYEEIARAAGGHGERVEDPAKLVEALERAVTVVREEKRQALVNVMTQPFG